jgi:uncharacterized pyridoxamine 5'-phosphate oxidase family protein
MTAIERVCSFIKDAQTYYLATVDGDQPRVRPFGTIHIFEDKLYIQTGRAKDVAKQLAANPKAEICAFKDGVWLRVAGELVDDDRIEPKKSMLDAYPSLRAMYDPADSNTEVLYFKNAKATFSSFTAAPETVEF